MTSFIPTIQAALRTVVTDFLSTTVEWRALTSGYGVEPRTYGSWTSAGALVTKKAHAEEYDEKQGKFVRKERIQIRTSDAVSLRQGDQFRLATDDAQVWAVDSRPSGGPGSFLYIGVREVGLMASGGDRGGGI